MRLVLSTLASISLLAGSASVSLAQDENMTTIGGGDRVMGLPFATRSPVIAQHGVAATAHPLASQVGVDVLKAGGSAVDAAIAINATLGLMEPTGCGIGGDLFAIVWDPKTKQVYGYNGSGRSPMGRTLEQLRAKLGERTRIPGGGSLPVSVPGTVDGWFALHGKFGRLSIDKVLAPAIGYARDGFPMSQVIAYYWARNFTAFEKSKDIEELDNAKRTYLVNGNPPKEGEIFKNPDLARTYEMLVAGGRDAYYKGDIARTIDAYFKRIGGDLRYEDFSGHEGEWVDPAHVNYRGYDVYELPPNTQGIAALQMLNILEGYDLKKMGIGSPDLLHVMVEAKRLAFEDLARYYADQKFSKTPLEWLLSDAYAGERRDMIKMDRVNLEIAPGVAPSSTDTTYFTVADKDGMMVSLIQSNFRGMGSGLVADGLGFMFQDRGELFSLEEGHPNVYAPGKRPFQTIIPAFVAKDGEPFLSFGLMGGDMQPQGHVQVIVNIVDFGMNVQEAGDAARWHHGQGYFANKESDPKYGELNLESGIGDMVRQELTRRGHVIREDPGGFGGYQAILWDKENRVYRAASESRKDGAAIGY
jgi:gamma-glutamyltranspeptidase/glutathione hydrolase